MEARWPRIETSGRDQRIATVFRLPSPHGSEFLLAEPADLARGPEPASLMARVRKRKEPTGSRLPTERIIATPRRWSNLTIQIDDP